MDADRNGHCSDSESIASDCSSGDEDKIHIGSEYQANVPNNVLDKSFCYLELDRSDPVWLPSKLKCTSTELEQYVQHAEAMFNICEEQSLILLHECLYDLNQAKEALRYTKRAADTLDKWSHEDRENFINAHNYFGKKFKLIQANLPNKSISDLVDYYYMWKKTRNSVSLLSQYCNVLALSQSHALAEESSQVDKSPLEPIESQISVDVQDPLVHSSSQASQDTTMDCTEPLLVNSEVKLNSQNTVLKIAADSCITSTTPELPSQATHIPSTDHDSPLLMTVDVLNSMDVTSAVHVLKDMVPEHLSYLLECLAPSTPKMGDEEEDVKSSQTNPMFARCTVCKQILDTWTFSSTSGIKCYLCKPCEGAVSREGNGSLVSEEANSTSVLDRLNQVCKQTSDEGEQSCDQQMSTEEACAQQIAGEQTCVRQMSNEQTCVQQIDKEQSCDQQISDAPARQKSDEHTCDEQISNKQTGQQSKVERSSDVNSAAVDTSLGKQKTLRPVPRALYFDIVDYIEIATNKAEYVDDMFKHMDREVYNLVKKVRCNNIRLDLMLDQVSGNQPLDRYRSSNNNVTQHVDEDKLAVLWSEAEILLAIQGFLTYGKDFQAISEILETKSTKQVAHFYQENRAYYNLDVLISEHSSKTKGAVTRDSPIERMDVL